MSRYLAIGSVCWDEVDGEPRRRLGGSVLFASRVALAAGWDVHLVTSGTATLEEAVRADLPGVDITVQRSSTDTVMAFGAAADLGPRAVPTSADPIDATQVSADLRAADVVHLAPILGEVTPALVEQVHGARFIGITPQGLLRTVSSGTRALSRLTVLEPWWAPYVHAVVLSEDEYGSIGSPELLRSLAVAVTQGPTGCTGHLDGVTVDVDGIALGSVAPAGTIGAGDTFAAAFFMALASGTSFADALEVANHTAARHVSGRS